MLRVKPRYRIPYWKLIRYMLTRHPQNSTKKPSEHERNPERNDALCCVIVLQRIIQPKSLMQKGEIGRTARGRLNGGKRRGKEKRPWLLLLPLSNRNTAVTIWELDLLQMAWHYTRIPQHKTMGPILNIGRHKTAEYYSI